MLLKERLKERKLILASRSPRRHELMREAGLEFTLADNYEVEEVFPPGMPARKVAAYLARLKSDGYPKQLGEGEILITADTVVILDGRILGKPVDREEAVEMLSSLSGRKHSVITGVMLRSRDRKECFSVGTHVWFRELRREEIEYYVDTFRPYDKAGAYGIQEWIGYAAIEKIAGSFYNVMGLPMQTLYVELEEFVK